MPDPFAHHPELRSRIADAETSFFRTFNVEDLSAKYPQLAEFESWAYSDAQREALRAKALAGHTGDLWIFAYGSLMWDPALRFAEVRRAHVDGFERRLILIDDKGGRGSKGAPGLMAALDKGNGCEGLAFRIAAADIDTETEILFRREMIGPGYDAAFVPIRIGATQASALTFLADDSSPDVQPDISRATQVDYIATGKGILGTSREYLANIVAHFAHLGIEDADCAALLQEVDASLARNSAAAPTT